MEQNPVGWFEIYVKDMDRARKFYEGVLNTSLQKLEVPDAPIEMYSFPMNPEGRGSSGALAMVTQAEQPSGNGVLIYFSCEDCAVEASRVEQNGGKLMQDKMSIGEYGFIAMFIDTEGNAIGLHSQK